MSLRLAFWRRSEPEEQLTEYQQRIDARLRKAAPTATKRQRDESRRRIEEIHGNALQQISALTGRDYHQ